MSMRVIRVVFKRNPFEDNLFLLNSLISYRLGKTYSFKHCYMHLERCLSVLAQWLYINYYNSNIIPSAGSHQVDRHGSPDQTRRGF